MKKIIFLDIDGVLNHRPRMFGLNKRCVSFLKRIIDETGAKIVVSSSWKYFPDEPNVKGEWRTTLASMMGYDPLLFIGDTPDVSIIDIETGRFVRKRGLEITHWLDSNMGSDMRFCIIDDEISDIVDYFEKEHIFKTNSRFGLTNNVANRIIKYLNG